MFFRKIFLHKFENFVYFISFSIWAAQSFQAMQNYAIRMQINGLLSFYKY